jgi:hypothetical protein
MADVTLPVQLTSPGGTGTSTFNYGNVPIIFNLTPNHGFPGTLIEINGENFLSSAIVSVAIAGISVLFVVVNDGQILVTAPTPPEPGPFLWPVVVTTLSGATGRPVKPFTYDVVFAYWDPPTIKNVTLGPVLAFSNLVVTGSSTMPASGAHVVGLLAQTSGKYYYEITWTNLPSSSFGGIAIAPYTTSYANLNTNDSSGGILVAVNSNIYSGNIFQNTNIGGFTTGDIVGVAMDIDNRLVWFKNVGGPDAGFDPDWNGGATGGIGAGSNPLTGVLGIPLPAGALVPFAMVSVGGSDVMTLTANFGQTIFAVNHALVTGFENWPGN